MSSATSREAIDEVFDVIDEIAEVIDEIVEVIDDVTEVIDDIGHLTAEHRDACTRGPKKRLRPRNSWLSSDLGALEYR